MSICARYGTVLRENGIAWFSQCSPRRLTRPKKQICGFSKSCPLSPNERQEVEIEVDFHAFGMYDTKQGMWVVDAGAEFEMLQGSKQQIWIPFQSWMSSCLVLFSYIEIIITNLFPVALRGVCWLVRYMGNDLNFHTHIILAKTSNTDTSPNGLMAGHVLLKVAHHGC